MKTLGLVGGIGPESTVEYYRALIAAGHTAVVIHSIDVARLLDYMGRRDLEGVTEFLAAAVQPLAAAGAEIGLLAANTPHIVFDEVQRRSAIPLVSIVEAAQEHVRGLGMTRVALFGTRFTMQGRFYPDVFARAGIAVVAPDDDEQAYIHDKYVNELLKGVFDPATRDGLLALVTTLKVREGIEAVILGGTELPLILKAPSHDGIPLLDTTQIHVRAALKRLRA